MDYQSIKTFSDFFHLMEEQYSDRIAFRWVDDDEAVQQKTYGEFCTDIRRGISCLHQITGNTGGQHIAILARNSYDHIVMMFASVLSNAVVVPLNPEKLSDEIIEELSDADISVMIHDGTFFMDELEIQSVFHGKVIDISAYTAYPAGELPVNSNPEALSMILFTSGTTGRSKGVMLNQRIILTVVWDDILLSDHAQIGIGKAPEDHISEILLLPLYHVAAINRILVRTIAGNTLIISSPKNFYRDVVEMHSDYVLTVPTILKSIHKEIVKGRKYKLGALNTIVSAGAILDASQMKDLIQNGYFVMNCYGMTELFSGGTRNWSQEERYYCSIGKVCRFFECKLEEGELCFRGSGTMLGYYKNPTETAETMDADGWVHTGDLADIDDDGYVYLTGRKKNLIILSSGENISPEELENRLLVNKDISEAIVRERNDSIIAEVFCEAANREKIEAFVTELNRTLPTYKYISEVEFRDTPFERTSTGKIKR